ncbi:MAG: sensor histidine kinase [Chitinophagaceae bacterium]
MNTIAPTHKKSRFPFIYECFIWFLYVAMYKYSHIMEFSGIEVKIKSNFPYPQLILYSLATTLYVIPFCHWLAPALLKKKRYVWFLLTLILYFAFVSKINIWLASGVFSWLEKDPQLHAFYHSMYVVHQKIAFRIGWVDLNILITDLVAFLSVTFMLYSFDTEQKKFMLEKDNLVLQLESLKAQLHPHFLFNTLNSIYGMSLTNSPETPAFILRLSDMMRFILYDCQQNTVPLEKDIEFLKNYMEMEKKRYPEAAIDFTFSGDDAGKTIAPLMFIPLLENAFKHGSHRLTNSGFIHGSLEIADKEIHFVLRNDFLPAPQLQTKYGGVGIENLKKRLQLYYPGKHNLTIQKEGNTFVADLTIHL